MEILVSKKMVPVKSVDGLPEKFKVAFQKFVGDYPSFQGRLGNIEYRNFDNKAELRTVSDDGMTYWINIENDLGEYSSVDVYGKDKKRCNILPRK